MRVKKQKRHRKIVRFYTACHGFRQPYKVLCDVTFVHHLVTNHITPADKALSGILGAPVTLFTTKCCVAELKTHGPSLGPSHLESLEAANSLITARCDHEEFVSGDKCIMDVIGKDNSEHFFVATQQADLRKKILEIPGVPVVYGLRSALLLEAPSAAQRQFVKTSEEKFLRMTEWEHKMLEKRVKNVVEEEVQPAEVKRTTRRDMGVKDKPQFKRKRVKGPNPLSCKPKKTSKRTDSVKEKNNEDASVRSRKKRKRSRKGKNPDPSTLSVQK